MKLLSFGEILWDIVDSRGYLGGAPFNLAAHAARCGVDCSFISCIGDDGRGRKALARAEEMHVDCGYTQVNGDHPTGTVGPAYAPEVYSFMVARFIGGLGVGISTVVAPLYISEISPPQYRGRLAAMFQFNIVFGILIVFLSNALLSGVGELTLAVKVRVRCVAMFAGKRLILAIIIFQSKMSKRLT